MIGGRGRRTEGADGFAAVRSMPAGTLVRLPDEHGGRAGYKHYTDAGASYVLVPGAGGAEPEKVGLAPETEVEILATPVQLADRYLRGELDGIDRRLRKPPATARVIEFKRPCDGREGGS